MSNAGRLLDDHDLPPPHGVSHRDWSKAEAGRVMSAHEAPRLAAPEAPAYAPPLRPAQRACYEALSLALQEGHVFAAVTGPAASGKTMVLDAVLSDRQNRALRCIRISDPDKVPARLAAQIEEVAYAEASKPENLERHVVLAVDDAHTASDDLLRCLARLAAMREPGRRVPQVLLVGRPELWQRLTSEEFAPLARRVAIRAVLPPLEEEIDPWASLEQEVSQTMSAIRAESALAAMPRSFREAMFDRDYRTNHLAETEPGGLPLSEEPVPPPMEYALFPDPPPRKTRSERGETKARLILPLGCLVVGVAVFGFVLSYYDWPDVLGGLPWSTARSGAPDGAAPLVITPQGSSHGLPRPFGWSQPAQKHSVAGSPNPYAPTQAAKPPAVIASAPPAPEPPAPAPPIAGPALAAAPSPNPSPNLAASEPPAREAESKLVAPSAMPVPSPPPALAAPSAPIPMRDTPIAPAPRQSASPPPLPAAIVRQAPLPAPVVALLLRRGEEQSSLGDIFAARLLFERAAEAGSAQGAFRLARTYDAVYLPLSDAPSLSDPATAKRWYARAAALGDREAATRLKAINEGR